jgi:hypothetical protein
MPHTRGGERETECGAMILWSIRLNKRVLVLTRKVLAHLLQLEGGECSKTLIDIELFFGNSQNMVPQIVLIFLYNYG